MTSEEKTQIERIIAELEGSQEPDWKDEWERGFDSGRLEAVRCLNAWLARNGAA